MKKIHRNTASITLLLCLLLAGGPVLRAQTYTPVPVTVSHSTVNIDGKTYYAHIVLERQTIYGSPRLTTSRKRSSIPPIPC